MSEQQPPPKPIGPGDLDHPRQALARLAVSSTAQEAADLAVVLVPTMFDESAGSTRECLELAARLTRLAQDVLDRAVVYAHERGLTWPDIADAVGAEGEAGEKAVHDQYQPAVGEWEDTLNDPWVLGHGIGPTWFSRLPSGVSRLDGTASYLDEWCVAHAGEDLRRLAVDDGIAERMVSARLPKHTKRTELDREHRVGMRLLNSRTGRLADNPEWVAHCERRDALHARIDAEESR